MEVENRSTFLLEEEVRLKRKENKKQSKNRANSGASVLGYGRRSDGGADLRSERPHNPSIQGPPEVPPLMAIVPPRLHLHPISLPLVPSRPTQKPILIFSPIFAFLLLSFAAETRVEEEGRGGRAAAESAGRGAGHGEWVRLRDVPVLWDPEECSILPELDANFWGIESKSMRFRTSEPSVILKSAHAILQSDLMLLVHWTNDPLWYSLVHLPFPPLHQNEVISAEWKFSDCNLWYAQFARQLTYQNFGVYAMDWVGHGGSDGLHGYVPSLDHVVADTVLEIYLDPVRAFLEKIKTENPEVPCFLYGHSTGGAVVLKAASHPLIESMLEGVILTSPALRVKPAHPIVGVVAPLFSVVVPRFQFKGANKKGIPVTRDPVALAAKYSDPLVYTGPIRVRTGHEILRICSYLMQNMKSVTVPFLVLHGTADRVTDPLASQDLYNFAASKFKDIKLYEGFLHDLLFEPEREEVGRDIINWMEKKLQFGETLANDDLW
ncbi:hypothetical protein Scep_024479 [Stephania cephalantha]|uniref:Serine aminopeptidase S33 domain-containing protein n=1 Tax=Stephania cephalantha TaxID=152367 RepID=A0AAP0F5L5_9MAGN